MFGYVVVNKPELKIREFSRYRGYYCGLCHMLRSKYGISAGFTLTYDMTFLILLLGSLYEPKTQTKKRHCPIHPVKKVTTIETFFTEYAADMNIILAKEHLRDDWEDEKKPHALAGELFFKRRADYVAKKYPRQAKAINKALAELRDIEKDYMERLSGGSDYELSAIELDNIAKPFSTLMGEIFVMREDAFAPILRSIGFYLGKYIYIKDAYDDIERDRKNNCFNPFLLSKMTDEYERFIKVWQSTTINMCIAEIEKLPLERDITILRNIIYEGVRLSSKNSCKRGAFRV